MAMQTWAWPFRELGKRSYQSIRESGQLAILSGNAFRDLFRRPFRIQVFLKEVFRQGVLSLPILSLASLATGMVLALQAIKALEKFGAAHQVAEFASLGLIRDLGPLLGALVFIAKAGSLIAAEIGTMSVTDQIKALKVMQIDPIHFLVVPRLAACFFVLPILVFWADAVGITGSALVVSFQQVQHFREFWQVLAPFLTVKECLLGLLKPLAFSWAIVIIACHKGMRASGGSQGVGRVTTEAVSLSAITVIVMNFFLTKALIGFLD